MPKLYKREKYLSRMRGFYHANDIIKMLTGLVAKIIETFDEKAETSVFESTLFEIR